MLKVNENRPRVRRMAENATVKERAKVVVIHLGTLNHTRVSAFLFGLCPYRTAATACLAVA